MLLGDVSILFVIAAVPILGAITFFVVLFTIVFRVFGLATRSLSGGGRRRRGRGAAISEWDAVCAQPRCGHVNPSAALFCARCGNPLNRWREIDDYG